MSIDPALPALPTLPALSVAVATIGARGAGLAARLPPPVAGVTWLVFWQDPDRQAMRQFQAATVARGDLAIEPLAGRGVAASRNVALAAAPGDILLFADDDLGFLPDGHAALRRAFAASEAPDFLCGRVLTPEGLPRKAYGPADRAATRFNCGKVGTPELALRLAPFRAAGVRFDPAFGAGSANPVGDEYIFLCDALRAGLRGRHVGIALATHPADSSGLADDAAGFAARRRAIDRALGPLAFAARLVQALRHRRRFPDSATLWRFLF
jgi:hypothetical protein